MNRNAFTADAPGDLVAIRVPTRVPGVWADDAAFVPRPLPPDWAFPAELWPLLGEAKAQVGLLEGLGRKLPNPGILLTPLRTREAVLSSRLEGTYVTARQVLEFELDGGVDVPDPGETEERNDRREVANYAAAMRDWTDSDAPLSAFLIRQLHQRLMTGVRGQDRHPGRFREVQVVIGAGRRFVPPPPERLRDCIDDLGGYLKRDRRPFDPLVDAFLAHYQFEAIHPFEDGNGRVGRLLLALCFPRWGMLTRPWLYLSPFFEGHRREYMDRLLAVSTDGDWAGWVGFCLEGVVDAAADTARRCDALLDLRAELTAKIADAGGKARLLALADGLFETPLVRVTKLAERFGVKYDTALSDCRRLADAGVLAELPDAYPKTYYNPAVFALAYDVDAAEDPAAPPGASGAGSVFVTGT